MNALNAKMMKLSLGKTFARCVANQLSGKRTIKFHEREDLILIVGDNVVMNDNYNRRT